MKIIFNLKWILALFIFAIFCRLVFISVYKVSSATMSPILISGDIVIASQISYGFKLPWMPSGYFESDPAVGDVIIVRTKNKLVTEYSVQRIIEKTSSAVYIVKTDQDSITLPISRDQIVGKTWFVVFSVGTTQDSISEEKSIRWNRFLTMIH